MGISKNKERAFKLEKRMMTFFKGNVSPHDEIDFETSKALYEVKSCKLFNSCGRKDKGFQLGRFRINTDNHIGLYLHALQKNKLAKYIFAVRYGNQIMFKVIPWEAVRLSNKKKYYHIRLYRLFNDKN